jgi:hypothetical protein
MRFTIEHAVERHLLQLVRPTAGRVAAAVYRTAESALSSYQLGAVRRVLRDLARRGIVTAETTTIDSRNVTMETIWRLAGRHALGVTVPLHVAPPDPTSRMLGLRRVPVSRRRVHRFHV